MNSDIFERIKGLKHFKDGSGNGLKYSMSEMQGWRNEMEDAHCAITEKSGVKEWSFFGIFDGHGGSWCSKEASECLWKEILDCLKAKAGRSDFDKLSEKEVIEAINAGFTNLDASLRRKKTDDKSGTTVVAALITKRHIYLINCGDSRGIFVRDNTLELTTFDHKPTQLKEKQRIQNAGGIIALSRVNGSLATSRGIGDFEYKDNTDLKPNQQFVSSEPDVYVIDRDPNRDNFIVLACDGIWDVKSNEQVQEFILEKLERRDRLSEKDLIPITNSLIDNCFDSGSKDNMSILLIWFDRQSTSARQMSGSTRSMRGDEPKQNQSDNSSSQQRPPSSKTGPPGSARKS